MSYFKAKMHKFDFGLGSDPDPAGGAHNAPPDHLAGSMGSYFQGKRREGRAKGAGKKGEDGEGNLRHVFVGMDAQKSRPHGQF